jgi:hypothetical protein
LGWITIRPGLKRAELNNEPLELDCELIDNEERFALLALLTPGRGEEP